MGKNSELILLILSLSFISLFISLFIISQNPTADGYELSIYSAFPQFYWLFVCLALSLGIISLAILTFQNRESFLWTIAFMLLAMVDITIILLPLFRNYFFSSLGDEVTHMGFIKDILITGNIGENVYPSSHMLVVSLHLISHIDTNDIMKFMPAIFFIIYYIGLIILLHSISAGSKILMASLGSALLFTYYNYIFLPTQFFLEFMPLLLAVYFRRETPNLAEFKICLVIFLGFLTLLHPLGMLFLVLIFSLSIFISHFLVFMHNKGFISQYQRNFIDIGPLIIALIAFLAWFSGFSIFNNSIKKAMDYFMYGYGTPAIFAASNLAERTNLGLLDLAFLFLKMNGQIVIYSLFYFISVILVIKRVRTLRRLDFFQIYFMILFIIFTSIYLSTLFGPFIETGPNFRILYWTAIPALVLSCIILPSYIFSLKDKSLQKICIVLLFLSVLLLNNICIFNIFPAPHIKQANPQVSEQDWNSMVWLLS